MRQEAIQLSHQLVQAERHLDHLFDLFDARTVTEDALQGATSTLADYQVNCAKCYGVNLEGQPNWKQQLSTGELPAPPHPSQ